MSRVDIVIPVYREGKALLPTLSSIEEHVQTPWKVFVCYDMDDDPTVVVVESYVQAGQVELVKNQGQGAHGAVITGFMASTAPFVIVLPADDESNAQMLDQMIAAGNEGAEIVCASRFMPGGCMEGCRFLKAVLVRTAAFTLCHFGRLPTRDATNGFRLFSRRVLDTVVIESTSGFTYSIELLVKCHRLGWQISEVPAQWFERKEGESRFRLLQWIPAYLRWYGYAFATTWLRKRPETVKRRT